MDKKMTEEFLEDMRETGDLLKESIARIKDSYVKEITLLKARNEKLVKTMTEAAKEIDRFYIKSSLYCGVRTIDDEDHSLWYARDILQDELKDE